MGDGEILMAANILQFPRPAQESLSGDARCAWCMAEWVAVSPLSTLRLQCPSCAQMTGGFVHPVVPEIGSTEWTCGCGHIFFTITPAETRCAKCGTVQIFD